MINFTTLVGFLGHPVYHCRQPEIYYHMPISYKMHVVCISQQMQQHYVVCSSS